MTYFRYVIEFLPNSSPGETTLQVLIIESDRELRLMVAAAIKELLRRKKPDIINAKDLTEAAGLLANPSAAFKLIVCAETVNDPVMGTKVGNGWRMLQDFGQDRPAYRVIVMCDEPRSPDQLHFETVARSLNPRSLTVKEIQSQIWKMYLQ